ncbi:MAG: acyl-CoA dehydrogenase family protein [Actinomycetota bacterium]|nr:acyl-CoA dehydrogenase family protein [Actinomycetota bacterium]
MELDLDGGLEGRDIGAVQRAHDWAKDVVAPMAETWEAERRFATEAFESAGQNRLTGLLVSSEDGGEQVSVVGLARVLEEIAAVDFAVAFSLVCHNNLAGAVARRAEGSLRTKVLPGLVNGSSLGAFLLTEPNVGSDAVAITVSAAQDGEEWVLNGEKAWATNGTDADVLSVYAQTDSSLGHRGIATFLIDANGPGVIKTPGYQMLGGHGLGANSIHFDNCQVPAESLFVPVGEGFRAAMEGIDVARVLVGAMCCGMLRTALTTASDYVRERLAFGGRLADLQGVRFKLADVSTDLEASRLLTYRAARTFQEGRDAAVEAAHAKKFSTRVTESGIASCMQVMGANGARRDHPLPRHLAASRLTHYVDGATEIQDVVISRSLLD